MVNRAGSLKKNLSGEAAYESFTPAPLPPVPPIELSGEIVELLVRANRQLSKLESISARIPNIDLFISMHVRKEALISSQIEGTQATLEDIFAPLVEENVNRNVADVVNYIKAVEFAIARLKKLPLCSRLLKEAHGVLMKGACGHEKTPGEFRHSQNWIGGIGSALKSASFIPPTVDDMEQAMSDLEKYINDDDGLDVLIRTGLIHYQFETIHPFLDGNGRIGRLLIMLYLIEKRVLTTPTLYISHFLKMNRIEYYDRMSEVRKSGDFEQWVRFFLRAVDESAEDAILSADRLMALHDQNAVCISGMGRSSKTAAQLFAYLEANPIINIQKTSVALGISFKTISDSVKRLCDMGILSQSSETRRNRIFSYTAYLDILREGT